MKLNSKSINYNVQTVDELVSLDGLEGDTVVVTDENRGGVFVYREDNVGTNNGGTIFNGWTRQYDGAVNVKWFGAKGDGIATTASNFEEAFNYCMQNNKKLFLPMGTYNVSGTSMNSIDGNGISITGEGRASVILKDATVADDYIFNMSNTTPDNSSFFNLSNVSLVGNEDVDGTFTGKSKALRIHNIDQVLVSNVAFSKFDIIITAGNCYSNKIQHCRFANSNIGIMTNISGGYFQNNTIDTCEFVDFWDASTSHPIDGSGGVGSFNYNTILNCNFESSGTMGTLDLSESSYNSLVNCRFERMNHRTADWIILGSHNAMYNCSIHMYGGFQDTGIGYSTTVSGAASPYTALRVVGESNIIELSFCTPYYNIITMSPTSRDNIFKYMNTSLMSNNTTSSNFYVDYGTNNKVVYDNLNTTNILLNSIDFSSFTLGTSVSKLPMNSAQARAWGYDNNGASYRIDCGSSSTDQKKLSYSQYLYTGQSYVFSVYVFCEVDNIIGLSVSTVGTPSYTKVYANKWVRLSIACVPNSTGTFTFNILNDFGIQNVFYVNAPQITRFIGGNDLYMNSNPILPSPYVATYTNEVTRNTNSVAKYAVAAPASGLASAGDVIYSLAPSTLGYSGWIATQTGDTYTVAAANMWKKFGAVV